MDRAEVAKTLTLSLTLPVVYNMQVLFRLLGNYHVAIFSSAVCRLFHVVVVRVLTSAGGKLMTLKSQVYIIRFCQQEFTIYIHIFL